MSKSNWQLWKEKNPGDKARPWDLLNPNIKDVPIDIYKQRYGICLGCPELINLTKIYKLKKNIHFIQPI